MAHFRFVTIHPFEDGNGRIARAVGDMALARANHTWQRFYSVSSQIEAERKNYYLRLEASQKGHVDITLWLEWFLRCLDRALERAEETLAGVLLKAQMWQRINLRPVNERRRLVLNRMFDGWKGHLTNAKYAKLAKCSSDTAYVTFANCLSVGSWYRMQAVVEAQVIVLESQPMSGLEPPWCWFSDLLLNLRC